MSEPAVTILPAHRMEVPLRVLPQLVATTQEPQELYQPYQPLPHTPACTHQVPDIEESLRNLETGLGARVIRHLLDQPMLHQSVELRGDYVRVNANLRGEFPGTDRIPVDRQRINDLLRL